MAAEVWYVKSPQEEMVYGPYTTGELRQLAQQGRLRAEFTASPDKTRWYALEEVLSSKTTVPKIASEKAITKKLPEQGQQAQQQQMFGNYQILQELGRGGSGIVYKALEMPMKRVVALKVLISKGQDARDVERFAREINLTAKMEHPHIVRIFHCGDTPQPFFTMEYIQGKPLNHLLRDGVLSLAQKIDIFAKVCSAIEYAHKQKIIHRDIKPGNVLMAADGEPKVADFGLARSLKGEDVRKLSVTGEMLGTPQYMSPEQADGKDLDQRADIYSLGAVLYEILTGRPPFDGDTVLNILAQLANEEPLPPHALKPGISRDLETICLKCLHKKTHRRYRTVGMLRQDIERFQQHKPIAARPPGAAERAWKWVMRNKLLSGVAAMVLMSLVFAIFFLLQRGQTIKAEASLAQKETEQQFQIVCDLFHSWLFPLAIDASQDIFRTVLNRDPGHCQSHWMRGCSYFMIGNIGEAHNAFKKALNFLATEAKSKQEMACEKAKLHLLLALCHMEQHDWEQARSAWQNAWHSGALPRNAEKLPAYLEKLAVRNAKPLPVYFRQPLPGEVHTLEKARYHSFMSLFPQQQAEAAYRRCLVLDDDGRRKFLVQESPDDPFKQIVQEAWIEQLYKLQYLLYEQRAPWINHMLEQGIHCVEIKDMAFYVQGQWMLDMASPYWVHLPVEWQQKYARIYQQAYAMEVGKPVRNKYMWQKDNRHIEMDMVLLPPGQFLMGTAYAVNNEGPQHQVIVANPCWMAATEMTQQQWMSVTGEEPWNDRNIKPTMIRNDHNYPAIGLSCNMIVSKILGPIVTLQLPDETIWEYACRAGTTSLFPWGNKANSKKMWYADNTWDLGEQERYARQVGLMPPNAWGLCDMNGNTYEICHNEYFDYQAQKKVYSIVPIGKNTCVYRGGCFGDPGQRNMASSRMLVHLDSYNYVSGCRLMIQSTK